MDKATIPAVVYISPSNLCTIDFLRKDVKKTIDIQLHKYVLEKFLYCYFLRENLSTDEILEIAKKETDYDRKMWLQDTAQGQWKSL